MVGYNSPNMPIPLLYRQRTVYHFTPIANLSTILKHGLLSISKQKRQGLPLRSIVWKDIQSYRTRLGIPVAPGEFAQDYVPFYFCKLSPMLLAVISNKVVDEETIIHLEFPISILEQYPAVFTDAAVIPGSEAQFYTQGDDLARLNWDAIDSPAWRMPSQPLRNARLAELLIHRQMPIAAATRIIVWDNEAARQVAAMYADMQREPPRIETDPGCYFIDPAASQPTPAVRGPQGIYQVYRRTVEKLQLALGGAAAPCFMDLAALRLALRQDFTCLPEMVELSGLETDNRAHFEDVGAHTRRVVAELLKTPEYQALSTRHQVIVETAAFLHDIGKGPKRRWAGSGGKQQIDYDHPVKALPMLERILTEEVAQVSLEDAELLCRLVAYHDIIGGVLTSGRRLEELQAIIGSESELDMFMALSYADASAINPAWIDQTQRAALRRAALQNITSQY